MYRQNHHHSFSSFKLLLPMLCACIINLCYAIDNDTTVFGIDATDQSVESITIPNDTENSSQYISEFKLSYTASARNIQLNIDKPISTDTEEQYVVNDVQYQKLDDSEQKLFKQFRNKSYINNVSPCTSYNVTSEIWSNELKETFYHSEIINTTYAKPIMNLTQIIPFYQSFDIDWSTENKECVSKYKIELKENDYRKNQNKSRQTKLYTYTTTTPDVTIEDLEPCMEYNVNLTVYDKQNNLADTITFYQKTSSTDPGPVQNISATPLSGYEVEIKWEAPSTGEFCVTEYNIKYILADCYNQNNTLCGYSWKEHVVAANETELIITNLEACREYLFFVYSNHLFDDELSPNFFTTLSEVPGEIKLLSYFASTTNYTFKWDVPDKNPYCVNKYYVEFDEITKFETENLEIVIENLQPCGNYTVTLYATDLENRPGATHTLSIQLNEDKPSAIENPKTNTTSTSTDILLYWTEPSYAKLCISEYRLTVWRDDENILIHVVDITTTSTYVLLDDFISCLTYIVQIIPVTHNNDDGPNKISNIVVPSRIPNRPDPPRLVLSTSTSLTLQAVYAEEKNQCQRQFVKFICRAKSNTTEVQQQINEIRISNLVNEYLTTLENLSPNSQYWCSVQIKNSVGWSDESVNSTFSTDEDYPGAPENVVAEVLSSTSIKITWTQPKSPNGQISRYRVHLIANEPKYRIPSICEPFENLNATTITEELVYIFDYGLPYVEYIFQVAAGNTAGIGPYSKPVFAITNPSAPEVVKNFYVSNLDEPTLYEEYNVSVQLQWTLPCRSNSNILKFGGIFNGTRGNSTDHIIEWSVPTRKANSLDMNDTYFFTYPSLRPEHSYTVTLFMIVEDVQESENNTAQLIFQSPAGIPQMQEMINWGVINLFSSPNPTENAIIVLSSNIFYSEMGSIRYLALLISETGCQPDPIPAKEIVQVQEEWPNNTMSWKETQKMNCIAQYQTTPARWNPYNSPRQNTLDTINYTIGVDDCKTTDERFCNGPLKSGTDYAIVVRVFTSSGFSDSTVKYFRTDDLIAVFTIILSIFACLLAAIIIGVIILWKTNKMTGSQKKIPRTSDDEPEDVLTKNFQDHYDCMMRYNGERLNKDFKGINLSTNDLININMTNTASKINENRNRYTNIYPYDANRVLLDPYNEDDSDYINASYINGYKYEREYIATQGPKLETCYDFWRMIIQNHVKTIVMLTPLMEGDKIKCYKYYPKYKEQQTHGNIQITCTQEIDITIYKKRLFTVRKDHINEVVAQYHYSKWPDHSSPNSTIDLIKFIKDIRNDRRNVLSPMVVHCSAGVGRSGTFIALDILMQKIKQEKKVNICATIKQLRLQRLKMVQTIEQYQFVYECVLELIRGRNKKEKALNKSLAFDDDKATIHVLENQTSSTLGLDGRSFSPNNEIESAM